MHWLRNNRHYLFILLITGLLCMASFQSLSGNIDPDQNGSRYAWSENAGWINFEPAQGPGVTVSDTTLIGFAWSENYGWINLNPPNGGVVNDEQGNLSGYAWSENTGWINFAPAQGGVSIDPATGIFSGKAWSENTGWINFNSTASPAYQVVTSWRASVAQATISDLAARARPATVTLTWTCVTDATGYNVYRSTTAGGPYELVVANHQTDYCTFLNDGLVNGTTYYYVVTSLTAGTESLYSNEAHATPAARTRR